MHIKATLDQLAGKSLSELQLCSYGLGYAWLRPEDERYVITDNGRRVLAEDALFGPRPTVDQVSAVG
jgi:hypothetical protein